MTRRLFSTAVVLSLLVPSFASAKIWPDDFLPITDLPSESSSSSSETSMPGVPPSTDTWDNIDPTLPAIPTPVSAGIVTRIDFVAAIVSRSVTQTDLDTCFADLGVGKFQLLFSDVPVNHPRAKELCVALKSGLVRGYADGTFRPNDWITTADASVLLVKMMGIPANPVAKGETWYDSTVRRASSMVEGIPQTGRLPINEKAMGTIICSLYDGGSGYLNHLDRLDCQ